MLVGVFFDFLIALLLTIVVEWCVVFLFGYRNKNVFLVVAMINLVTNPLLNYIILVIQYLNLFQINMPVFFIIELLVILAEWRLLIYAINENDKKLLILSVVMNLASFISGLVLFSLL